MLRSLAALLLVASLSLGSLSVGVGGSETSTAGSGNATDQEDGNQAFSDQPSLSEMFKAIKRLFDKRDPATLDRFGASPDSLDLLEAYGVDSVGAIPALVFENLRTQQSGGQASAAPSAVPSDSDKFAQVKGFRVEISGAGSGKDVDNAWESCSGGELIIEVTETTIGADKFQTHAPGHAQVSDITLHGALTDLRKPLRDWARDANATGASPLTVFFNSTGVPAQQAAANGAAATSSVSMGAWAAHWFKDEILVATLDAKSFGLAVVTVKRDDGHGTACFGPPRIFLHLPAGGPAFMPLGIGGTNFDVGSIPYFNAVPSMSLFNFAVQNIPLIGSVAVGFTIVPPAAPAGDSDVTIQNGSQASNPLPFNTTGTRADGSRVAFGSLVTLEGRATLNGKRTPVKFNEAIECQVDWPNTTMPGPKQDLVRALRVHASLKQGDLSVTIDNVQNPATDLKAWFEGVASGKVDHRAIAIVDSGTQPARTYSLVECFPLSFSGGDFTTGAESNLAELRVNATRVELA